MAEGAADVVIVGAGPVGLLTGILLAQEGVTVEIIERRSEASAHSRAIGIHPPALAVLAEAGIGTAAIGRGVRIESGEVRCDGRVLGRMSFAEAGAEYPFVLSLPQRQTEQLLHRRIAELPGVRLRRGLTMRALQRRADGVEVEIDGTGGTEIVRAAVVVGADGARSRVRQAAGIRWRPSGAPQHYVMADYPDETDFGTRAVLFFERGGVVESFPLPGGQRRWVAMTDRAWSEASNGDLAGLIAHRTGIRPRAAEGTVSAFVARQNLADRLVSGRVVLVGDAAHEVSPIGGQGMNLGWLDAASLAPAVARVVREGDPAALSGYERMRRGRARIALAQAGFNMGMGRPASGLRLAGRNAAVRVLAVPPVRAVFARAFTMRWL
ncbi:MAG: NAD(P)/FAD-dependent oxidoreductase [Leifsonia sp.]